MLLLLSIPAFRCQARFLESSLTPDHRKPRQCYGVAQTFIGVKSRSSHAELSRSES